MRRREALAAIIAGSGAAFAGPSPEDAVQPHTRLRQRALRADEVLDTGGFGGDRMRRNISARLLVFDINPYVKLVEQHQYTEWNWLGEQPGKWLEAAILAPDTFRNSQLHESAATVLRRLIAAQQPDGYLGITDTALRTPDHPLRGMDAYELYFT